MIDILALQKRISELEAEVTRLNDQQTAMLIYADLRINKMVKERSHDTNRALVTRNR